MVTEVKIIKTNSSKINWYTYMYIYLFYQSRIKTGNTCFKCKEEREHGKRRMLSI